MSDNVRRIETADRADRLMTVASGWAAVVLALFGLHRWLAAGTMDWWARAGLILGFGLGVMWIWGYWPTIAARFKSWARGGGLNTFAIALGLIVALIIVNTLVRRRAAMKWDLTKNQRYTLSPRSAEVVRNLKGTLKATIFVPKDADTGRARDLFRQYADASDKFDWRVVDPLSDQKEYLAKQPKLSPQFQAAVIEYNGKRQDVTDFTEKEVTSAILKLTRETPRKLLFTKGHGEPDPSAPSAGPSGMGQVVQDLKDLQWPVETVDLLGKGSQAIPGAPGAAGGLQLSQPQKAVDGGSAPQLDPEQVAALVIAGPRRDFEAAEVKQVNDYLNKGGKVLLLLDDLGPSFEKLLAPWGIKTTNDIVIGQFQQGIIVTGVDQNAHAAVKGATGMRLILPPMHSVTAASPAPTGITVTEILNSGPASSQISNFVRNKPVDPNAGKPGPTGLAAIAEKSIGTGDAAKKARLLVMGGYTWATDQWVGLTRGASLSLASGLVNYVGEEEALVSIPPKDENTEQAFLTTEQERLLTLIHFWDFPLLALVLAIVVYVKRR
jgi:hypothetical protein